MNLRYLVMSTGVLLLTAAGAAAENNAGDAEYNFAPACVAPDAPQTVDGNTATQDEIDAAHRQVEKFIRDSDSYQQCLGRALGSRQDLAFSTHSSVPVRIVKQIERKGAENQKEKERVGREYNAAVAVFSAKRGVSP
ncbi:MAG: hypothetical protein JO208_12140 [Alphaproteobacteria bacterium]|nr:hypothetical protein [Alphaproteobacteria bacterium]